MANHALISACADLIQASADADEFSGVVLIAREGVPLLERAHGYACWGHGVHNRIDTRFNIGSLTKMFTAVSIGQLAEQGKLDFDDVIAWHLPEYPLGPGAGITIHQLLTHTSGLGSFWNARFEASRHTLRTVSDYLALFVDDLPAFAPGERFGYSNSGYIVLGAIVERISGRSYEDYLTEEVFGRAGMTNSGFPALDEDTPNCAVGYLRGGADGAPASAFPRTNMLHSPLQGSPAGGSYATALDLLRFARALAGHELLGAGVTDLLCRRHVAMGPRGNAWYGYGFGHHEVGGVSIMGHNGGAPGVGAQLDMYRESGYTVVILSNYDAGESLKIVTPLRELLSGEGATTVNARSTASDAGQ